MAGVIEQGDIRSQHLIAEVLQGAVEMCLVEIKLGIASDDLKTQVAESLGHKPCVIRRSVETRYVSIIGIADHQGNALVGTSRRSDPRCQSDNSKDPMIAPSWRVIVFAA